MNLRTYESNTQPLALKQEKLETKDIDNQFDIKRALLKLWTVIKKTPKKGRGSSLRNWKGSLFLLQAFVHFRFAKESNEMKKRVASDRFDYNSTSLWTFPKECDFKTDY